MKIAHVINPVKVNESNKSYLFYTQPITFQSMIDAKNNNVELYAINYPEDDEIIPDGFIKLPFLERSIESVYGQSFKKLPFIQDILDALYETSDADILIYTNADIGVAPNFYKKISQLCQKHNSLIINRRNNLPKFINNKRITATNYGQIFNHKGDAHVGYDCFVFKRYLYKKINLNGLFVGYPHWDTLLMMQLLEYSNLKILRKEFLTFHLGKDGDWKHDEHMSLQKDNIKKLGYNPEKLVINNNLVKKGDKRKLLKLCKL